MAVGAVLVALAVGTRQTAHVIGTTGEARGWWRKEKIDALHRKAHMPSCRNAPSTPSACSKELAMDPNRVDSLLWLKYLSRGSNFAEAIRLHQRASRVDERNIEILLELANDLRVPSARGRPCRPCTRCSGRSTDILTALIRKRSY
jgi:hypothetical protein